MFLSPRLVAQEHEDSAVLVHATRLTVEGLTHPRERDGIIWNMRAQRMTGALDGAPLIWHFSWVRADRRALHKKCEAWGHKDDKKWSELIDAALDGLERGVMPERDFVHGYPLDVLPAPAFGWDESF
jgi:hypothetical protein